jgi:NAD(P)H dehydrogenase (quinone)
MEVRAAVIYHSELGHTEKLAFAIAEGAREVNGTTVEVTKVEKATHEDLLQADAVFWGSPTHFGNMSVPMKQFIDGTLGLFYSGRLAGKVGSVFSCSEAVHGDQEAALWSLVTPMLQHGMIIVGLDPTEPANDRLGYTLGVGASSLNRDAEEKPDAEELAVARSLGRRAVVVARQLKRGADGKP